MNSFRIGSASEYLNVQITGRSHAAEDYWDANWVNADIEIDVGSFRGRYGAYLRAEDIRDFRDALVRLYSFDSKDANFETMEGQLSIHIKGDGLGHFTAECEAMDKAGIGNRLVFVLTFDQTDVPATLNELDRLIKEYPVIGKPDV